MAARLVPVGPTRMVGPVQGKMPERVGVQPGAQLRAGQVPVAQKVGVIGAGHDPVFDQVARVARQITDMVPV